MNYETLGIEISELLDDGVDDFMSILTKRYPELTMRDVHIAYHVYPMPHTLDGENECHDL